MASSLMEHIIEIILLIAANKNYVCLSRSNCKMGELGYRVFQDYSIDILGNFLTTICFFHKKNKFSFNLV